MLSTAIVHIIIDEKKKHKCQALLDKGSQVNIIRAFLAKRLKLSSSLCHFWCWGCWHERSSTWRNLRLTSRCTRFHTILSCLTLDTVISNIPISTFQFQKQQSHFILLSRILIFLCSVQHRSHNWQQPFVAYYMYGTA